MTRPLDPLSPPGRARSLTVRLTEGLQARLEAEAARRGLTVSETLRAILEETLPVAAR